MSTWGLSQKCKVALILDPFPQWPGHVVTSIPSLLRSKELLWNSLSRTSTLTGPHRPQDGPSVNAASQGQCFHFWGLGPSPVPFLHQDKCPRTRALNHPPKNSASCKQGVTYCQTPGALHPGELAIPGNTFNTLWMAAPCPHLLVTKLRW